MPRKATRKTDLRLELRKLRLRIAQLEQHRATDIAQLEAVDHVVQANFRRISELQREIDFLKKALKI